MITQLDEVEARVLGALVEKSVTTPDQYPLSFQALLGACNQRSNRSPVMTLDPDAAGTAVSSLIAQGLVEERPGVRTPKFMHNFYKLLDGESPKVEAVICVLLLRGAQTPGELKTRTDRMYKFQDTAEVEALLEELRAREEGGFVARLPKLPGQREHRYQHLFCGEPSEVDSAPAPSRAPVRAPARTDRLDELEKRMESLEKTVEILKERLGGAHPDPSETV